MTEKTNTENFNFFHELAKMDNKGKGIDEVCHSKIIAWLLNAKEKNEKDFQYSFLKNFIQKLYKENEINITDFMKSLSEDITVKTEFNVNNSDKFNKIDIFLYSKKADFVCVIENKIDGELGKDQLKKYVEAINDNEKYKNCKYKKFVYLRRYLNTVNQSDKKQIDENNYEKIEYSDIEEMIDYTVLGNSKNEKIYFCISQYKEFLEKYWYN